VSTAAQRALSTASSVASTAAAKSGSRWASGTVGRSTRIGAAWPRSLAAVENATKISPLP
jgi:hypothetical protein